MLMNLSNLYGRFQIGNMLGISILFILIGSLRDHWFRDILIVRLLSGLAKVRHVNVGEVLKIPTDKTRTLKV